MIIILLRASRDEIRTQPPFIHIHCIHIFPIQCASYNIIFFFPPYFPIKTLKAPSNKLPLSTKMHKRTTENSPTTKPTCFQHFRNKYKKRHYVVNIKQAYIVWHPTIDGWGRESLKKNYPFWALTTKNERPEYIFVFPHWHHIYISTITLRFARSWNSLCIY